MNSVWSKLWKAIIPCLAFVLAGCQSILPLKVSYTLNIGKTPDLVGYCKLTRTYARSATFLSEGRIIRVTEMYRDEWNVLMCRMDSQSVPAHYLKKLSPLEIIQYRLDN